MSLFRHICLKIIYGGIALFFAGGLISCGGSSSAGSSTTTTASALIIPEDIPPGFDYPGVQVALLVTAQGLQLLVELSGVLIRSATYALMRAVATHQLSELILALELVQQH